MLQIYVEALCRNVLKVHIIMQTESTVRTKRGLLNGFPCGFSNDNPASTYDFLN